MITLLLALHVAAAVVPARAAAPGWCAEAERAVTAAEVEAEDDAFNRYERAVAAFPVAALPVVEASRAMAGEQGGLQTATFVLRTALDHACSETISTDAAAARAEVASILAGDPRFTGVRDDDDAIDRWLDRLWAWISALLESRAMQGYAGSARAVYLAVMGALLALAVWRVLRGRRRGGGPIDDVAQRAREVERARIRAFAEWRALAASRLDEGDARGAFYAARMALLARLGEVATGAVTPARTHTEILARLDDARRAVVAGPLADFDRAFYGGAAGPKSAQRFLADVDAGARALDGGPR